ncbi:MAG: hypothetical protein ACLFQM_02225 [Fidelibacterota bacterium]
MGKDRGSVICNAHKKDEKREMSIQTETPFELIIRNEQYKQKYTISSGK